MGRPWARQSEDDAVASAVSRFGAEVKPRLQGVGARKSIVGAELRVRL